MNNKKVIGGGIIAIVVFLLVGWWLQQNAVLSPVVQPQAAPADEIQSVNVSMRIDGIMPEAQTLQAVSGQTLLGLMRQLNDSDPSLNLETQTYSGLGDLVVQIGNLRNTEDNKYWQYEVNGEMPMIGADRYILQPGDQIVWSFRESEQ